MNENHDMQELTRRLLVLWQEQISLMSQDPETLNYGEIMFKAMGMPVPDAAKQQKSPPATTNQAAPTQPAGAETTHGTAPAGFSPEQHRAMVDELTGRINELAGKIAEYEAGIVSSKLDETS